MTFASMKDQFAAKNAALLGLSVDSNPSHIAWTRAISGYSWNDIHNPAISFPIAADDFGAIARQYGMLMPSASATKTVRNVYLIDPEGTVRAILAYPLTTGRNVNEIYRLLLALQAYDATGNATPANWQPGDPQILPISQTAPDAQKRLDEQHAGAFACIDWYLCLTDGGLNTMGMQAANENQPNNQNEMDAAVSAETANSKPAAQEQQPAVKPPVVQPLPIMPADMGVAGMTAANGGMQSGKMPNMDPDAGTMGIYADMPIIGRPFVPYDRNSDGITEPSTGMRNSGKVSPQTNAAPVGKPKLNAMPTSMRQTNPVQTPPPGKSQQSGSIMDGNRMLLGLSNGTGNSMDDILSNYYITRSPKQNP